MASLFKFGTLSLDVEISSAKALTSNGKVQVKRPSVLLYHTSESIKLVEPTSGARGGSPKINASAPEFGVVGVGVGVVGVGVGVGVGGGVVAAAIVKLAAGEL